MFSTATNGGQFTNPVANGGEKYRILPPKGTNAVAALTCELIGTNKKTSSTKRINAVRKISGSLYFGFCSINSRQQAKIGPSLNPYISLYCLIFLIFVSIHSQTMYIL